MEDISCKSCGFSFITSNKESSKCPKCGHKYGQKVDKGFFGKLFSKKNKSKNKLNKENKSKQLVNPQPHKENKSKQLVNPQSQPNNNISKEFMDGLIAGAKKDQDEQAMEREKIFESAGAYTMLPPPNIKAGYDCECGSYNYFNLRNMTLQGGLNVSCADCGAMLFVPPTILDHSEYWETGDGASLVKNWRDQLKFVNHGRSQK